MENKMKLTGTEAELAEQYVFTLRSIDQLRNCICKMMAELSTAEDNAEKDNNIGLANAMLSELFSVKEFINNRVGAISNLYPHMEEIFDQLNAIVKEM